jgi:hypothetical protein
MASVAQLFWVIGGEYTDTTFSTMVGDEPEHRLGPFDHYDEAKAVWRARAMETIDDAHVRYRIEEEDSSTFWVVGGSYTGTDFKTIEGGGEEERHGPFADYEAAKAAWRTRAMDTIDDAHVRYRIEKI